MKPVSAVISGPAGLYNLVFTSGVIKKKDFLKRHRRLLTSVLNSEELFNVADPSG